MDPHAVTSLDQLRALYDEVTPVAASKSTDRLDAPTRAFIAASPFCLLGTQGSRGNHITPRGDAPGFVEVLDDRRVMLPDRKGNNRLDGLRDILEDNRVSLLFLVPGVNETLRLHGLATISTDPALRARCVAQGKTPTTVLVVEVREIFMQCAKAFMRSGLWAGRPRPTEVPTMGQLIAAHKKGGIDPAEYDQAAPARLKANLY
ncbi:pyridoxamine 5'-phosphate oxidase family protein [Roseococcus sp. SDR]|uniref:pyridoxamine 5'-phosphate oxidase family protein n=1 Tax=Roseococcus sp. SDR TaxID=2835532 RepID=UPI001BD130A6|nr:pyridoxamine 5'-phosphate oxidase family protein [Roseococcus sp. SDR]MBS7791019.1 pyridoxamine 5'-phosphate oxidase family protein [Roseococcus sp. SDR]MBV1846333.1 pyridoxamine 5'-phosphate oxidase family protein [Roseococcus sp. SDR]